MGGITGQRAPGDEKDIVLSPATKYYITGWEVCEHGSLCVEGVGPTSSS